MRMKLFLNIVVLIFTCAVLAAAHPLGNFTVNQYSRLEIEKSQVKLRFLAVVFQPCFRFEQISDLFPH